MFLDKGMVKEHMVHMHTMKYYSAIKKNEINTATWMDLKIIILDEVRQRKTNII